eukprot:gene37300-44704_t
MTVYPGSGLALTRVLVLREPRRMSRAPPIPIIQGLDRHMADDDLDLNALSDEELTEQMWDDLYDGLADAIEEGVRILLDRGWTPYDILTKALVEGMRIVGNDFRDGILFVPE